MNCKELTIRSQKHQKYYFCRKKKKTIDLDKCQKCKSKKYKQYKPIKNKSKKLAKIEKNRKSILTNNFKICFICGNKAVDIHEVFKGANRLVSIKNDFCVPLCRNCHNKTENEIKVLRNLQKQCQIKYEEDHTRDEFIKLIGKSFIKE